MTETPTIEKNHALLESNSRWLKSNADMMRSSHELLLTIAAELGIAA